MRILVINPNSNAAFSDEMDKAVAPLRFGGGVAIDCISLVSSPLGIETQRDIDAVIDPVCSKVIECNESYDAFVIACFADPAVQSAREVTHKPVIGICEAGLSSALNTGERFGVISTSNEALNADLRLIRSHGLMERCVGLKAVNIPVVEMTRSDELRDRLLQASRALVEQGAETIVLGCAGMSAHRKAIQQELSKVVIDPVIAATAMAIGIVAQGCAPDR
ncbi:aspartate/glutamate racemase family protein [Roseibium sp. SCP14]|uniref:aspartate/glutamate racemase family protein n=1 Tax=Roseibium sp. SCP14 TaxID=3141375 RepID=UPI00333AC654